VLVLGIESSCDETSAAAVEDGQLVRSNVVSSQVDLHGPFGGVVPEIASRQHVRAITVVVRQALQEAGVEAGDLDTVAATVGPGLAGALLVGASFAKAFALGLGLPFVPVNHIEGHMHSVWLARPGEPLPRPQLPMLVLIVSGGHTELVMMHDHGGYTPVGRTVDDAAGEGFDKVARILGLGYPGGPAIQTAAARADDPVRLPRAWLPGTHNFSFSGLKTAALHAACELALGRSRDELRNVSLPSADVASRLSQRQVHNLAAGFQHSVVDVLVAKTMAAAEELNAASIAVVGGVAANALLRERLQEETRRPLFIAPLQFSTDNAAMIAAAAYFVPRDGADVDVQPALRLTGL
jgi:N6-L-threonylcarbamoyladenine synthase